MIINTNTKTSQNLNLAQSCDSYPTTWTAEEGEIPNLRPAWANSETLSQNKIV